MKMHFYKIILCILFIAYMVGAVMTFNVHDEVIHPLLKLICGVPAILAIAKTIKKTLSIKKAYAIAVILSFIFAISTTLHETLIFMAGVAASSILTGIMIKLCLILDSKKNKN